MKRKEVLPKVSVAHLQQPQNGELSRCVGQEVSLLVVPLKLWAWQASKSFRR
jgi:hypothetical protein